MLEKICEKLPFGWTFYASLFDEKKLPICTYSTGERHDCRYLCERRTRLSRFFHYFDLDFYHYCCNKKVKK